MSKTHIAITMSLDGFIRATNPTVEEPLGQDGERLHRWAFAGTDDDREVLAGVGTGVGAIITGRNNYNDSVLYWGADGPTGPARVPVVVVTHTPPNNVPDGGVYEFVEGLEAAIGAAKRAAEGRDVTVMGGASIIQQVLAGDLADSIQLHVAPVLFGQGLRLFDLLEDRHVTLVPRSTVATPFACHLRYDIERI